VGEISSQVSISPTFYKQLLRQYFFAKNLQSQAGNEEKMCETLSHKNLLLNVGEN